MDALDAIFARRSVGRLTEPAPAGAGLQTILEAGAAAPDHGELRPWRFVLLAGEAKVAFGQVLARAYLARAAAGGEAPHPAKEEKERTKLGRAPLVVVVAAVRRADEAIPWEEQRLAAGAAAQNMLLAATALGYGSMWRTGDPAYDPSVKAALGLREEDAVIGFLYIGTPHEGRAGEARGADRGRPALEGLVEEWMPPG